MNSTDYDESQSEAEIERVLVFIKKYNSLKGTNYQDVVRSTVKNETDIFCYNPDHTNLLTIQLRKSDTATTTRPGNRKKIQLSEKVNAARRGDQFLMRIPNNISSVEAEFAKKKKDITNTILLLDDAGTPPEFLIEETKKKVGASAFKEGWLVCRNNAVFKLF